jgi:hypothetical protein
LTVGSPRRRLHQPRCYQVKAVEQLLDLVTAAEHQRRRCVPVNLRDLGCLLAVEVAGGMREHQEAARRHSRPQPADDPGWVLLIGDEVQHRDQQHPDRPGKVQQPPHPRMAQDRLGLAQIGQHRNRGGVVGQQRAGVHMHHWVVIDIGHASVRRDRWATSWTLPWVGRPVPMSRNWRMPISAARK